MSIQPDIYTTPAPAATMAQEGSSYYDSPYMVEFYNLKWGKPSMPDMGIYWEIFTDAVTQHREAAPDKPFSILDVGTGAGRVPIGLLQRAAAASFDTRNIRMIGLDNAQHMLDLAAKLESKTNNNTEYSPCYLDFRQRSRTRRASHPLAAIRQAYNYRSPCLCL